VELLVVIAIIIVLVGLLLVGVFKALDTAYQARTRTDETQIAAALEAFKSKYQVTYIPSRLILCKSYPNYFNAAGQPLTQLHQDSLDYLNKLFPRITTVWGNAPFPPIDWNQNGIPDPPISLAVYPLATPVVCNGWLLEGEQCMVFFAGGIPNPVTNTVTGFAKDPTNPANPAGDRDPPLFNFQSSRLQVIPGTAPGFPSYLDSFGKTPYAFFSSYKSTNGYNRYVYISNPYLPLVPGSPITSDCQALQNYSAIGLPPFPYCQSGMYPAPAAVPGPTPAYLEPDTYQIISAGKDNVFGYGTVLGGYPGFPAGNQIWVSNTPGNPTVPALWNPSTASLFYPPGQLGGGDDIANFYDKLLGVSQ
jgi:type II secretory pathway pseudopilin PulG